MSGLRERKKERNRKAILDAAGEIICEKGFDATTIDEVARRADVGVGTVYNYFGSKSDLLLAIFSDQTEKMMAAGGEIAAGHPDDVLAALSSILDIYFDGLLQIDRRLLTEGIRIGFARIGQEATALMELDYKLIGQLAELLTEFQAKGLVNTLHSPPDQALTIYSGTMIQVLMLVYMPDTDIEVARTGMHKHIEIIVNGLRAR